MSTVSNISSKVLPWGNGLGLRITKPIADAAGAKANVAVNITAEPGRIVIELAQKRRSLKAMLADYDPKRHGSEVMALRPLGKEIL